MKKLITLLCVFLMLFTICALPVMAEALAPAMEAQEAETITTEPAPKTKRNLRKKRNIWQEFRMTLP